LAGDVDGARRILYDAYKANEQSEKIWLAAVKLEKENDEYERARRLLERARQNAGTARVWMKSAILERDLQNYEAEKKLLDEGLEKFPTFDKLWMMKGQLLEKENKLQEARTEYKTGIKNCPHSIPLWICASRLEEKVYGVAKARALLEKARLQNPQNPDLWLEAIKVELRSTASGSGKIAQTMLAKALQDCPTSGKLWALAIQMEKKPQKKARSFDALKRCDNDPHVMLQVAILFWEDRKMDKARTWFNRVITLDPDFGDAWATFYKFEVQNGAEKQREELLKKCIEAEPRHGEIWQEVSKNPVNSKLKTEQILKRVALVVPGAE